MPVKGIQKCTDIPAALLWLQLLFDTQGGVRRLCGEKGERERETSEWLAAKSSPGRISGMEGSLRLGYTILGGALLPLVPFFTLASFW